MANEVTKPYLRKAEVAALFGVDPGTVTRWAQDGLLPTILTMGRQRRYPREQIMRIREILRARPSFDQIAQQEVADIVNNWKQQSMSNETTGSLA